MRKALVAALFAVASCTHDPLPTPPEGVPSMDAQLRQLLSTWGAVPIRPVAQQNPALVSLGQMLFFDKILSGNRDVSCGTCHNPLTSANDGLSLAIGTGSTGSGDARTPGAGRPFVSRNAPTTLNTAIGLTWSLWDGRISSSGGPRSPFSAPAGIILPAGLANVLAAQAMLPVLNRVEMRGTPGDYAVTGAVNELANFGDTATGPVWQGIMARLLSIQEYATRFANAYPTTPASALGFEHAANAIAAFETQSFMFTNSPFDRYLARDDGALTPAAKRGAILFFGSATCAQCHSSALLGGNQFVNIGVPQIGPGVGSAAPLDIGRAEQVKGYPRFSFRVPPLRNVELTAPYMHDGAYPTLEAVLRHYTNPDSAQRHYDPTQLGARIQSLYHGDAATVSDVLASLDPRLRRGIALTPGQQLDIISFLKSLTDPAARDLAALRPASVPSGLPIP